MLEEDDDSDGHDDIDVAELPPQDQTRFAEYQQVVEAAKATLNVAYREDGPPLGLEFDDIVAPTTAGAGKAGAGRRRKAGEDDPDFQMGGGGKRPKSAPRSRPAAVLSPEELERLRQDEEARAALLTAKARQQVEKLEASIRREQDRLEREREKADMRLARERERELARLELERRKHLERMLKEQKKEEERRAKEEARLRALQEKEERRLALAREKELRAEERQRERNEKRKEREVLKALTQQERQALRLRSREPLAGPKDDVDFEWEALAVQYRKATGLPADIPVPPEGSDPPEGYPPLPTRPQFPPSTVQLLPVIDSDKIDNAAVGSLLSAWSSLSAFSHILAVEPLTVDDLLAALAQGIASKALADVHIALLRLLQADAEEAFAAGEGSGAAAEARYEGKGAEVHVVAPGARMLEEAWAWGFDVDAWRAHLTQATWPEIAREMAIAAGLGRKRPQRRREDKQRMGQEGEDVVVGGAQDKLELKLPARLARGTVKGAAWLVLKDAGYDGLHVEQIAKRIQHKGLRDLRTSKTPEASVAGALARDVLFERVAPATFALQSIRAHYRRLNMKGGKKSDGDGEGEGGSKAEPAGDEDGEKAAEENERGEGEDNENEEVDEEEEDEDEEEDENEEEEEVRWMNTLPAFLRLL